MLKEKSYDKMTDDQLLALAEWHAQGMQGNIISEDTLASIRDDATKDSKKCSARWSRADREQYRYIKYIHVFTRKVSILRKKHIIALLHSPMWYTKLQLRIDENGKLEVDDPILDELEAIRKECGERINRMVHTLKPAEPQPGIFF